MMSGPWEEYQSEVGPWTEYATPQKEKEPPLGAQLVSAAVRPVANAVSSFATLPLDAGWGLADFLKQKRLPTLNDFNPFASNRTFLPSDIVRNAIDQNTIAPATTGGKMAELASTVLLGARTPGMPRAPAITPATAEAAARARAGIRVGSGQGESSASISMTPEMRMQGGGYTFGTVGDDVSAGLTVAQKAVAESGKKIGMRMTPGQATGSRALQQMEAKLESQPMTSGPFNSLKENNARVLNRATAQSIGEKSDVVDSETLNRAFTRLSDIFEDAADDFPRKINQAEFLARYSSLQDEARGLFTGFEGHPLVRDFAELAETGHATGKQIQSLTSKLGKAAYKQMTTPSGDRDLGRSLYQLKDYADDLLQQGMSFQRAQRFTDARRQYRNLMMLTSRVGVVNPSSGNVSGRALANTLQRSDKTGFLRGQNQTPMYDAARFAQAFGPIVGDSGTATRSALPSPTDMLLRLPTNIATRAYLSTPSVKAILSAQAGARAAAEVSRDALMLPQFGPNPYLLPPLYQGLFSDNER